MELLKEDDETARRRLATELHDLQHGVQAAIQEIIAICDNGGYLTLEQRMQANKSPYLSYHKGIIDGYEEALKIIRKHTGGTVL